MTPPEDVIARVDTVLAEYLEGLAGRLGGISPAAAELIEPIRRFTARGKRIRALVTWWGFELAGGDARKHPGIARAATSVELLHAAALIHDDIIDDSDTRRGRPAIHAAYRADHRERGWQGDPELYGVGAGIIAGDLCLSLSEEIYTASGLDRIADPEAVRRHDDFRRDVMVGQFLDIRLQAAAVDAAEIADRAHEVLTYKSAKYSVEQPLLLGAALGAADAGLFTLLSEFGLPLGRAFQLRDDELGVFGDPSITGKPSGDDLRQGKKTVLVGNTLTRLDERTCAWFADRLGAADLSDSEIERMKDLMRSTGALAAFEAEIDVEMARAHAALDRLAEFGLSSADRAVLADYAMRLTRRTA
nr:polyprenyl synthetase family protein [Brevibacterium daeguense]